MSSRPPLLLALLLAAALLPGNLAAQEPDAADGRAWRETWRIELSRGATARPVWVDSLLLVASLDRNVHLVRLGREPDVVWKENWRGGFEASPVVTEDRILLAETAPGRRLVALDRRTREIVWTGESGDVVARPVVALGRIHVVSSTGDVVTWDRGGRELWRTPLATRVAAAPAVVGGALVVAASDGRLFALDPETGAVRDSLDPGAGAIWGDPLPAPDGTDAILVATMDGQVLEVGGDLEIADRRSFPSRFASGPASEGGLVVLAGHEGTVWAYDWAGARVVWQSAIEGALRAAPAIGDGFVAVGDLTGTLSILDRATGARLWHARLDGAIGAPPVARGRALWVMTEGGRLYGFEPVP